MKRVDCRDDQMFLKACLSVLYVFNVVCVVCQDCHSVQQTDLPCLESSDTEIRHSAGRGHARRQRDAQISRHEE